MKSRKYLTVIPDRLAKVERENVYVTLDVIGNSFSWLQICPRYKIDKEGDRILNNSEMYLRVASRSNEYFHTSDLEFFNYVIDKNIYFSQGFLMTLRNIQLGIDNHIVIFIQIISAFYTT